MAQRHTDQRIWHKAYPPGIPAALPLEPSLTLPEMLRRAISRFSDRTAYEQGAARLSYARLDALALGFAAHLQAAGLQPGDRLAIMLPNTLPYPVGLVGGFFAGLVLVNVNPLYTARELAHQLCDSGARAILILEGLLPVLREVQAETNLELVVPVRPACLQTVDADGAWQPELTVPSALSTVENQSAAADRAAEIDFAAALADGLARSLKPVSCQPEDPAFLQYTGGTTGVSKGAILTHANMSANATQQIYWLAPVLPEGEAVIVTPLPLYHIYPLMIALIGMARGCCNRLVANPREPAQLLGAMRQGPFDMFLGINTLFTGLLANPELTGISFKPGCYVVGAGAAVQEAVADKWKQLTGTCINEAYGLTECSPCVTLNPTGLSDWTRRIGLPIPNTDVRLVDEQGQDVPLGQPGELLVKGPQVFAGYWQRPDETVKVLSPDGWLSTGDIAVMDERGYLSLVDRKKDMILVSGFNVYPNEIEAVVALHDGVLECACIGVPDARSGEAPHLYLVPKHTGLTAAEVEAHCRRNLTAYKVPRHITFVAALPKSTVGKILRKELRHNPVPAAG